MCLLTNELEDCFSIVPPSSDSDANVRCGNFYLSASICRYWETYLGVRVLSLAESIFVGFHHAYQCTRSIKKKWGALLCILFTFLLIKTKRSKTEEKKNPQSLQRKEKKIFFFQLYKVMRIGEIVYWCKATDNKEFIRNSNTRELRQIKCSDPCWKKADTVHTKILNCQQ